VGVTCVLLLDIDGVLQFPRPEFIEAIERDYRWSDGYLAFQRELFRDPEYLQTLVGEGDILAVAGRILPHHAEGLTASTFLNRWLSENIEPNQALLDLLPSLKVEQVYLASNQEPIRGTHVERLYARYGWLSGAFLSYRVGHRKPNPDYFEHLLQTIGRRPDACLFVDDAESCVAAAAKVGIPSVRFLDNDRLISEFTARGLIDL
jgi:HAD superfamily hydrolase (TIGR01509 family)